MSVTKVSGFTKDSFVFGDPIKNYYGSSKIYLSTPNGGPLLFKLNNCLSYGIKNKFGNSTVSLALKNQKKFLPVLELLESECAMHVGKSDEQIMRCLFRKGKSPILYVKITDETKINIEDCEKYKQFRLNAVVKFESIFFV